MMKCFYDIVWHRITDSWISKATAFYARHLECSMEDGPKVHAISTYSAPSAPNTIYKQILSVYTFTIFDINLLQI
jgi:predicted enzyme related to lactoylglutathione lyase